MEFFRKIPSIDFMRWRRHALVLSMLLNVVTIVLLFTRGLNLGLDFTGGTLVEVHYNRPAEIAEIRQALSEGGIERASVQHFGTTHDALVRLPVDEQRTAAEQSNRVMAALRGRAGETLFERGKISGEQQCVSTQQREPFDCAVQMRRAEFVGPQVGGEMAEKGALALLFAMLGILIYVAIRFEWRFAVGAVVATIHDVLLTVGFFVVTRLEFSLVELAAVLTILGYSLNDTVVVFDRIRENFRRRRPESVVGVMNASINETLSRTIMTSTATLFVVVAMFVLGGDALYGFAASLIVGIFVGTYSSIFIASPAVVMLGLTREDMLPVKKESVAEERP